MARELVTRESASGSFQRPAAHPDDTRAAQPVDSDPLAELARLIGQTDPSSSFGRGETRDPQSTQDPFARDPYDARHRMTAAPDDGDGEQALQPPSWLRGQDAWRDDQYAPPVADDRFHVGDQAADPQQDRHEPPYATAADQRYDEALYGRAPGYEQAQAPQDGGPPYAYPGHEQGHDDTGAPLQEEAPSRRRGGLLTVAVVVALAVVGTAGAFAYRALTGGKSGEPPVIRADANPTKVVPPIPSKDPSGKIITDRIGASGERVVSREETPVDVKPSPNAPRVVFPPPFQPAAQPAPPAAPAGAMAGGVSDEPKRIRTVSVRADQAETATRATTPPAAPRAPAPLAAAPATGNGPIQLSPQRPTAPETRPVAAVPPPRAAEPGGYLVQVSSQRSEADAQASYRALQAKFPSVLASRAPLVKRVDLGDKGVYYRAMVGPFASLEQATQMCDRFKSAGGQCVVPRN